MMLLSMSPNLQTARDYLDRVVEAIAANSEISSAYAFPLARLKDDLTNAIQACEAAERDNASFEVCSSKQSHVLWLCNQCDYYLTVPVAAIAQPRKDRGLWQIRAVVSAIARFKIISQLRGFLPGSAPASIAWKDILPGLRL